MNQFYKLILLFVFFNASISAQTTVNSLSELRPFLDQDSVNVKLVEGIYSLNADDVTSGEWGVEGKGSRPAIMLFSGSNSTFDFSGVTIEMDPDLFWVYGSQVYEINIIGNNNTLKNLTVIDLSELTEAPRSGVINLVMDGIGNTVDGFDLTTKGSYPYGYGDAFGKSSNPLIPFKKHSGILIRGNSNTLRNTKLFHRGFGHCIAFQGAQNPLVEDCQIESEVRSTDEMLTDTSGPAYELDFWSRYNVRLPAGYTKALCEDGLRAYADGTTVKNGSILTQTTENITLKNNTVKNARNGCHMTFAGGTTHIENITLIGCELGFSPGNNTLINCSADCTYGPAYYNHYTNSNTGIQGDLTILDPVGPYHNGNGVAAFFGGSESANINLHGDLNGLESDLVIKVGGNSGNLFDIEEGDQSGSNKTINNYTNFPIVINSISGGNTITTCGRVENNGVNNTINASAECSTSELCYNKTAQLEAECADTTSGVEILDILSEVNERGVTDIYHNDWIAFKDIDLSGVTSVNIKAASEQDASSIEVRAGSISGDLIANVPISNTTSLTTYETFSSDLRETIDTLTDIYIVFIGDDGVELFNLDKINFVQPACLTASYSAGALTNAASFCEASEIEIQGSANPIVTSIQNGDYLRFSNYEFGRLGNFNSVQFSASSGGNGGMIELRKGGVDGELLTSANISTTGLWTSYKKFNARFDIILTGLQDLFLVFKGDSGDLFNLRSFQFYIDDCDEPVLLDVQINAEDYCDASGADIREASEGGQYIAAVSHGDYFAYGEFDFDNSKIETFEVTIGKSSTKETFAQLRLDDADGEIISSFDVSETTGGSQNWNTSITSGIATVSGKHKLYLVFEGASGSLVNFNWFKLGSMSVGTNELNDSQASIQVTPNPTTGRLTVNLSVYRNSPIDYRITSIDAKRITSGTWDKNHQDRIALDFSDLRNGLYFLQVKSANNALQTVKFFVMKY